MNNSFFNFFKENGTVNSINYPNSISYYDSKLNFNRIFYQNTEYFDYSILIGRFQIFTNAHKKLVNEMLNVSRKIILIIGSDFNINSERTINNPFTTLERIEYIKNIFIADCAQNTTLDILDRIIFIGIEDVGDIYTWTNLLNSKINLTIKNDPTHVLGKTISIFGYNKDNTSYYLNFFPNYINMISNKSKENLLNGDILSASIIRKNWFINDLLEIEYISKEMKAWLEEWKKNNPKLFSTIKNFY